MTATNFKVIIVGGGPVGLTAAHMLAAAGIDFEVLERRESVTVDEGASLALWPPTFRVLDQLGLLSTLEPQGIVLREKRIYTLDGAQFATSTALGLNVENHGYAMQMFHRAAIMGVLYNGFAAEQQQKIHLSKKVVDIVSTDTGVVVSCADGTSYAGDMVLGADGVHSRVRSIMRGHALCAGTPANQVDPEDPFPRTYRLLFGNTPKKEGLEPGLVHEAHGKGRGTQLFIGEERMWFFVFEEIALSSQQSGSQRYTKEDEDAFVARVADVVMAPGLTFGQVWTSRNGGGMADLGEGVMRHWHSGGSDRIVLAGDAAHKVTPNIGWGFNMGVGDVVALTNLLRARLLSESGSDRSSATATLRSEDLDVLFASYEAQRKAFVSKVADISARVTRMGAWRDGIMRFLDRRLWPAFQMDRVMGARFMAPMVAELPVLEFLDEHDHREGKVPWVHEGHGDTPVEA